MPVCVWKQVRRKRSVSSTSIPVLGCPGSGSEEVDAALGVVGVAVDIRGVIDRVMAWTLCQNKDYRSVDTL